MFMKKALAHTIELHRLTRVGRGESEAYEQVCESLDDLYPRLSAEEKETLRLVAGDLYVTEPVERYAIPATGSVPELVLELQQSSENGRWQDELRLLRLDLGLEKTSVAFLRARAYLRSGLPLVAFELAQDQISDGPYDEGNALLGIEASSHLPANSASFDFMQKLLKKPDVGLFVTASAIFLMLRQANALTSESREALVAYAPSRLQLAFERSGAHSTKEELSFAHLVLGLAHETIGKADLALDNYRKALDADPESLEALQMLASVGDEVDETKAPSFSDETADALQPAIDQRLSERSRVLLRMVA